MNRTQTSSNFGFLGSFFFQRKVGGLSSREIAGEFCWPLAVIENPAKLHESSRGFDLAAPGGLWCLEILVFFHTNHALGTLDFTISEDWAPINFP